MPWSRGFRQLQTGRQHADGASNVKNAASNLLALARVFRDVHNLLKANPVKWTECELETSLGKLTSATFQTSHYGGGLVGCPAAALPHGSPELCTHNHKFTRCMQKYGVRACGRRTRCAEKTLIRACEIVTIPGSRCQMAPELEGHNGRRETDERWANGGQNHKCGVSHGQTEKIYD